MIGYVVLREAGRVTGGLLGAMAYVWLAFFAIALLAAEAVVRGLIVTSIWGVKVAWPAIVSYVRDVREHS